MMPYRAYLDMSGDASLPTMGAGAYIARVERWQRFDVAWSEVLHAFDVPELHMWEFAGFRGPFKSWREDEDKRRRFLTALADVIRAHTDRSISVTLFVNDYKKVDKVFRVRERLGSPYSFTMLSALTYVRAWHQEHGGGEPLDAFIEHGDADQSELLQIVERLDYEHSVQALRKRVTSSEGTSYVLPFQACDFLAYETVKAARRSEDLQAEEINARKSFLLLTPSGKDSYWRYIDVRGILAFVRAFKVPRR
jgi:hypothetical protein